MSRSHPHQWVVNTAVTRPNQDVIEAFRAFPTTQIADSGGAVGVVGPGIAPLTDAVEMCGPATTIWTKPGDILFVLKAPDLVERGDVVVIDSGARLDAAVIGDIVGGVMARAGADGLIVDGAVRDLDGLRELGIPTFARGVHPATGSKDGPGALNVPIQCGAVAVEPGDIIRGDASGLVVIPQRQAEKVLDLCRRVAENESRWKAGLADGIPLSAQLDLDNQIKRAGHDDQPVP